MSVALAFAALADAAATLPPNVTTGSVAYVTSSSATLNAYVDGHGQLTSCFSQYGLTSAYGAQTLLASAGNGTVATRVTQVLTGLQPGTTYHYRAVAVSPVGTTFGRDRTFTTAKPLTIQITGAPNPVTFGNPFIVEGALSGPGAANHGVVLQARAFPYVAGFRKSGNPQITDSLGRFTFRFPSLFENAEFRVVTAGKPAVTSPAFLERVAVRVTLHVRSTRRRRFVRLYGTVSPAEVGASVGFQLLVSAGSVNRGGTVVRSGTRGVSRFSRVIRIRRAGLYRAFVEINDGAHASSYSRPVLIR